MGTNCVDNSPTPKAARDFLTDGVGVDETRVRGYEFMQVSSEQASRLVLCSPGGATLNRLYCLCVHSDRNRSAVLPGWLVTSHFLLRLPDMCVHSDSNGGTMERRRKGSSLRIYRRRWMTQSLYPLIFLRGLLTPAVHLSGSRGPPVFGHRPSATELLRWHHPSLSARGVVRYTCTSELRRVISRGGDEGIAKALLPGQLETSHFPFRPCCVSNCL